MHSCQSQFCNKSCKITNLFNVHSHLFDILLFTCLPPDVADDDLQQKLHVFFVFSECLVIFLYQCHTPFCCVINSLHGAETTFCSSIAFLFLPHHRICGQKFNWQMKEMQQVRGLAGDQVIQCARMERVQWNFWAFGWSIGFCFECRNDESFRCWEDSVIKQR